ncbi:MAG: helix-turn-helix transcriptional regulator [Lentisphaerae bacterium]|jgi:ArsR family transcriptional regulator, arsenate/arsenite/antimonite-responsive transcriptional repressor|nr:helix-turn-helix transcriptional regulator [Lentisphaerota bacterium]MBT5612499.1 helix-turn-helix transcriptional regulator [Lentisphaerota bacterium]MBT7844704.1 helix-turn-helix transcriptional regulator [Lentisphaerota bacterium]
MDFAKLFKALSHPLRLEVLGLLPEAPTLRSYQSGRTVNEIVEALHGSQPNVSHHLKILREAGLVRQEKVRNCVYNYKDEAALKRARDFLQDL